ncbi:MAG: hypothetical protein HYY24_04980 [Verrucomicrobia bacterium]|nr:hypothetical protein [Verrucomicrobiota bacterium]
MKRRKSRKHAVVLIRANALDRMEARLRDIDQKLDYLIKNLRRFNGRHDPFNHHVNDFLA